MKGKLGCGLALRKCQNKLKGRSSDANIYDSADRLRTLTEIYTF